MGSTDQFFGSPSKDKFAKMLIGAIGKAADSKGLHYDSEAFAVRKENSGEILNLGNAYTEYCAADRPLRRKVLQKWVRAWFMPQKAIPEEYEDARHDLLPAVRGRAYYDVTELRMELEGGVAPDWPYQPIGEHLAAGLVYDMHEAMRIISQENLDKWGVTFYEAMEVALENLKQLPQAFIGPEQGEGVYLSANGDSYDASRLLLLGVIGQFRLRGEAIAVAPTRATLIVTGSDDLEGLRGMLALAQDAVQKQPGLVSSIALRLDGEEWVPWLPDPSSPLFNEFKLMREQTLVEDYRAQKELLDKLHEKRGEDLFVATYNAVRNEQTGRVTTYTVWAGGITSWLPRADLIALMGSPDDEPRMYEWEQVVEAAGGLLEPLDMYPPRYLVSGFPSDDQFAAMGEARSL